MEAWRKELLFDPLPALLAEGDPALAFFARRDLLDLDPGPVDCLWELPGARKILKKQQADGSWAQAGENPHPAIHTTLIETWKHFRVLVERYGMTREHPQGQQAAEFLFSCQTGAGDIRGFLANQYATYYTGAVLALLIQAGYGEDARVVKGLDWLLSVRQNDGGWSIPILTRYYDSKSLYRLTSEYAEPVEPDRTQPFSHNWTGMVLRAFALQPEYRDREEARHAARLLMSRFFQPDVYTSYQNAGYWVRFDHPFWWNSLVTALDSLSRMGFDREEQPVDQGVRWLVDHQRQDGLWNISYAKAQEEQRENSRSREKRLWISLAICRVLKRLQHAV